LRFIQRGDENIVPESSATPRKRYFWQLPLQIGIISAFVLLTVPSILGIIWFVYHRNLVVMRHVADDEMARASEAMISESIELLNSVGRTVDLLAGVGDADLEALRKPEVLPVLLKAVRNSPQIYSFYAGFDKDGAFNQVIRIPNGVRTFGQNDTPIPDRARYVLRRLIRPMHGQSIETYDYLSEEGATLSREAVTSPNYDPRVRPFFLGARVSPGDRVTSEIYTFLSTGKVGVTISRGFGYKGGGMAGAAAADLTLDSLSEFLKRHAPGKRGIAIIVDDSGRLVAHPDPEKVLHREGNQLVITNSAALDDLRVRGGLRAGAGREGHTPSIFTGSDHKQYFASLTPFPANSGRRWELLIVVPVDDFVGELRQATQQVLLIGLVTLLIVICGIRGLSKALTSSIDRLIEETQRIRRFELDGDLHVPSRIKEIIHLTNAMRTVKTALRSVANFMPRTLVRDLLSTGIGLGRGGENRVITVMFTDLANFSSLAEKVCPQDLTLRTSDYLEVVSQEIIQQRGTIDKYIGDSVMALWNAPILDGDHCEHACIAALRAARAFQESNDRWARKGWEPLGLRIGLHADSVVVGVIGSPEHMSYTALGDGVNIAARLEGINKVYGTSICVSGAIHDAVSQRFVMRPLDHVAVKGRSVPILIYELMGTLTDELEIGASEEQREKARMTDAAFQAWMKRDFQKARALYQLLLDHFPSEGLARLYLNRCNLAQSDVA
jgi:adenylate cyclase